MIGRDSVIELAAMIEIGRGFAKPGMSPADGWRRVISRFARKISEDSRDVALKK